MGTHPEHSPAIQEEPDLENQWEDAFDGGEARAMARALAQVLGSGSGVARLDASVHAPGRILWQQKVGSPTPPPPLAPGLIIPSQGWRLSPAPFST